MGLKQNMKLPARPKTPFWLIQQQTQANPFGCLDAIHKRYGDIFTVISGSTPMVVVGDPLGIKQIFTNTKEITAPGALNRSFALMTGNQGVLQLDGFRHKHRRKLLMQTFHGERMQACGRRICELTEKIMSQQIVGKSLVAYSIVEDITLAVSLEVVTGLQQGEQYEKLRQLAFSLIRYWKSPTVNMLKNFPLGRWNLGRWSLEGYQLHLRQEIFDLLDAEVKKCRKQAAASHDNMLSDLIFTTDETGELLSDEEVRDLLLSPMFAAQDASATAIAWSLYWIHRLPDVRSRLLQELDSLGEDPDPLNIVALPYLGAVCNEALRIYPTQLFTFPRLVESPIELMDYELSPGTVLVGSIYLAHQQQNLYPEPKQFKPERFLENQFSPYEFLPFGGGARSCIGGAFALFEMKLILATMLAHYKLTLVDQRPEKPKFGGLLCYPASGVKMLFHGRRRYQEPAIGC